MPKTSSKDDLKAFLAHKEIILRSIKYYKKRIEDFRSTAASNTYVDEGCSSGSEDDLHTTTDTSKEVQQLHAQKSLSKMCFQATEELSSVQVLDSGVKVLVNDPVIEGELPVKEPGLWREVTAECQADLVPFSITFYVHQSDRKFSPCTFRGLTVVPLKPAHEKELATSVLAGVSRPADAVQVLRSYADAYRSRRTSLALLADEYASNIFMESLANGGYLVKCANLIELKWRLENKWSPLAPFHHKMKFECEYMDECYIKIIKQTNKQLADPTLTTDERTLLLAKIMSTCLEVQGTGELVETESEAESLQRLEKRRTMLDEDLEAPVSKKKKGGQNRNKESDKETQNRDDQIMAPPKSLPKKVKPKGKENIDENRKSVKRPNVDESGSYVKKAKIDKNVPNNIRKSGIDQFEAQNEVASENSEAKNDNLIQNNAKNKGKVVTSQKNIEKEPESNENTKPVKKTKNKQEPSNKNNGEEMNKNLEKSNTLKENTENATSKGKIVASSKNDPQTKKPEDDKKASNDRNIVNSKNDPITVGNKTKKNTVNAKNTEIQKLELENKTLNNDKPQSGKNTKKGKKKTDSGNQNADEITKNQKNADNIKVSKKILNKNSDDAKKDIKNAKRDLQNARNDIENTRKEIANAIKNSQLEDNAGSVANKEFNDQDEQAVVNKETNIKAVKIDNAISNKDKDIQKNSTNKKTADKNTDQAANAQNIEKEPEQTIEARKQNLQKTKSNAKNFDKNTDQAANAQNIEKEPEQTIEARKQNLQKTKSNAKNFDKNTDQAANAQNIEKEPEQTIEARKQNLQKTKSNAKNFDKNTDQAANAQNIEKEPEQTIEARKQNLQKTKSYAKNFDKNTDQAKKDEQTTADETKKSQNPKNIGPEKKSADNLNKKTNPKGRGDTTEKVTQVKNVAIKKIFDKNTDEEKKYEQITTDETKKSQNPKNSGPEKKSADNLNKKTNPKGRGDTTEKVAKVKNAAIKNKEHIADRTDTNNVANVKIVKQIGDGKTKLIKNKMAIKNLSHRNPSAQIKKSKKSISSNLDKNVKASNTAQNFKAGNIINESGSAATITSKIPQKIYSPISEKALKKNHLRISPRKLASNMFKSSSDSNIKQKILQKPLTNIPRLKKPGLKPK